MPTRGISVMIQPAMLVFLSSAGISGVSRIAGSIFTACSSKNMQTAQFEIQRGLGAVDAQHRLRAQERVAVRRDVHVREESEPGRRRSGERQCDERIEGVVATMVEPVTVAGRVIQAERLNQNTPYPAVNRP